MTPNAILMQRARQSLSGHWLNPIVVVGLYWGIQSLLGLVPVVGWIASLIVTGALSLGMAIYFLAFARGKEPSFSEIWTGFVYFTDAMFAFLLVALFTVLWALLLIVPGIIAALGYAMVFYIMADNPGIAPSEALRRSKSMMLGRRWKLFCLGCRFIGWMLLCIITMGIALIWVLPYVQASITGFYLDLQAAGRPAA